MFITLIGEDPHRSTERLLDLKEHFLSKFGEDSVLLSVDASEDVRALGSHLLDEGLFSPKKMIVVKRALSTSKDARDYVFESIKKNQQLSESGDVVLVFWDMKVPKNLALYKHLKKYSKQFTEYGLLSIKEYEEWARKCFKKLAPGVLINNQALAELVRRCGTNTGIIANEIEKLVNTAFDRDLAVIDADVVSVAVIDRSEVVIFELTDAIRCRDMSRALRILEDVLAAGNAPQAVLGLLVSDYRARILVLSAKKEGFPDVTSIAKYTKLHPFVVKKALESATSPFSSLEVLERLYQELLRVDIAMKSTKTDPKIILEKFIIKAVGVDSATT